MLLGKVRLRSGEERIGFVAQERFQLAEGSATLSDVLHADDPAAEIRRLADDPARSVALGEVTYLAPIDRQEVWAAGVTYKRSREARERESAGAGRFYDLVYSAPRPELFFKANPHRVAHPGEAVRIRRDSRWSVPEPELALVLSPRLKIVGYTVGNDMSARDIEGENPLYLPQAKVYDRSCALGPVVALADAMPPVAEVSIGMTIDRGGRRVFEGQVSLSSMARSLAELVDWLGREASFPDGVILLTGTGIVPPDDFALATGDVVSIDITGIGRLTNVVEVAGC
ncbi:MAG: fumarylacetoacetate hydrolase family protein [Gemmataceae bacterium]|nr:fumarylacetoacetate hydrolase family protein [Gemmataceae bacterium]MDW8267173.1 fumarylacetoacetate hydrolase family protein [Gemmataceae bacterium]